MKETYVKPEMQSILFQAQNVMAESPIVGDLDPVPWELDSIELIESDEGDFSL